jgi:hypothetical protein
MSNLHMEALRKAQTIRRNNNPRCALIRIYERRLASTEALDWLLDASCSLNILRRTWTTMARMEAESPQLLPPSEDRSYQGCYLLLRAKVPWLMQGEESIRAEFETAGVNVHSVQMLERNSWKKLQDVFLQELQLMRNCLLAGDEPPFKLIDPEKGGRHTVVPRGPQMTAIVEEPPCRTSPGLRSVPTLQCLERLPVGYLHQTEIVPFNVSILRVRRSTLDTMPPAVRDWVHSQLRNCIRAKDMHDYYSRIPLAVDQRMKYLPERLFTRKGSALSTVLDYITDYHQQHMQRSFHDNTQTGLHRLRITICVRICRAPRMEDGFKPIELCDVYDLRAKHGARGTTAEDQQMAMRMTATARFCLMHPEVTPMEAEHFVYVNPLDWQQLVKEDACRAQGPGSIARKAKRLFTDRDPRRTHVCREELRCASFGKTTSACLHPYCPALFDVADDGSETLIDYEAAKAAYDRWFDFGEGGPPLPWLDERSPLGSVLFVPLFLNYASAGFPQQVRHAIIDRLPSSHDICDLLVPAAHTAAEYQGENRWWSSLCRQVHSDKRAKTQLAAATPIQISWHELMIDSRRSRQFWDGNRETIPLVMLFPCRESTASIMWLMRQAFVRAAGDKRKWRERVIVIYNPAASVRDVGYRTWDPCFPAPVGDAALEEARDDLLAAARRALAIATTHPSADSFVQFCERVEKAAWAKGRSTEMTRPAIVCWCAPPTNLLRDDDAWHPLAPRLLDPTKFQRYGEPLHGRTGDRWAMVLGAAKDSTLHGWCPHRVLNVQSQTTSVRADGTRVVGLQTAAVARSPQDKPYPLARLRSAPYRARPLSGSHPAEYNGLPLAAASLALLPGLSVQQAVQALLAATERIKRGGQLHMLAADADRLQQALAKDDWAAPL